MAVRKINRKQKHAPRVSRIGAIAAAASSVDDLDLSPSQMREVERRIADLNCRTRYLIVGVLEPEFVLYYNVSEDSYGWNDATHATLFKRRKAAQAILGLIGGKDALVECQVNRKGQLVKKSVRLPDSTSSRGAAGLRSHRKGKIESRAGDPARRSRTHTGAGASRSKSAT